MNMIEHGRIRLDLYYLTLAVGWGVMATVPVQAAGLVQAGAISSSPGGSDASHGVDQQTWLDGSHRETPASKTGSSCPVDIRGEPFGEAMQQVAGRLGVTVVFDVSVTDAMLRQRVRLYARHLNGGQVIRWLARWVGAEAVRREGMYFIAAPGRIPVLWRPPPTLIDLQKKALSAPDNLLKSHRIIAIDWEDAPLSRIARDVADGLGIDVIFAPQVMADQRLVTYRQPEAGPADVAAVLADQLAARVHWLDGALWVHPPGAIPADGRAATRPADHATGGRPAPVDVLDRPVVLDQPAETWQGLADRLETVIESPCRIEPPAARDRATGLSGQGTVRRILDDARAMGRIRWSWASDKLQSRPTLRIVVPAEN